MLKRIITSVREQLRGQTVEGERSANRGTMAREMKRAAAAAAAVLLLGLIGVLLQGGQVRVYDRNNGSVSVPEDVSVTFRDEGIVFCDSVTVSEDLICVEVGKLAPGETVMTVSYPESSFTIYVKATRLGFTVNQSNDNFGSWPIVVGTATAVCLAVAFVFLLGFARSVKSDLFSYATVTKLAVGLFFSLLGFMGTILMVLYLRDPMSYSFNTFMRAVSHTALYFAVFSTPFVLLLAVMLCVSNVTLIRREGFRPVNALGILLSGLMVLGFLAGIALMSVLQYSAISNYWTEALSNAYYGIYDYLVCLLFSVFLIFFLISRREPAYDKDCVVILGCAIRPDGTLYPLIRGRVDRALRFARKQEEATGKALVFIPSGGQGPDEVMPEAEAMAAYLRAQGVPEERILPETRSVNTIENMRFSREIAEGYRENAKVVFCTTNYHVFRSGILAGKIGWKPDGMGSRTKWYFWPNALVRETIGLVVDRFFGVFCFCLVIAALMLGLSFFA